MDEKMPRCLAATDIRDFVLFINEEKAGRPDVFVKKNAR
jgi:hypothetical protein